MIYIMLGVLAASALGVIALYIHALGIHNIEPDKEKETDYKRIEQREAKDIIDSDAEIIILDVRTQDEYSIGHIKDAVCFPVETIDMSFTEKYPYKDARFLIYCRSGRRSEAAARKLLDMGYTDVLDFGGINTWEYDITKE